MVGEKAPGVNLELEAQDCSLEQVESVFVVHRVNGDDRSSDAADEDVVHGAGIVQPEWPSHRRTFAGRM